MAIGTTAAIVGGLIAAGGHTAGAIVKSKAEKAAAKTQSTAANIAGRRQDRANQDAFRYLQAGRMGQPYSPYPPGGGSLESVSRLVPGGPMAPGRPQGPPQMQGGPAAYQPFSLGNTSPGGPPGPSGGGQMVTIKAPTGATRQVPAAQAQRYVSRGGRVIRG